MDFVNSLMYKLYKIIFSSLFSSSHKFSTKTIFSSINSVVDFNLEYSMDLYLNDIFEYFVIITLKFLSRVVAYIFSIFFSIMIDFFIKYN